MTPRRPGRERPVECGAGDHRRRAIGAAIACASPLISSTARAAITCGRSRPIVELADPLAGAGSHRAAWSPTRLQSEVDATTRAPGARRQSDNLAARNLYLQGRYHLNQRTEEGLHKAVDFFEKAIIEDAQFSLAHSGLADAYGPARALRRARSRRRVGQGGVERGVGRDARRALGGGAHLARARARHPGLGLRRRRAAVPARHPAEPALLDRAPLVRDVVPRADGRLDEALEQMLLAQSLDPVSSIIARDVRRHAVLPARLRRGAGTVRSHDRAQPALRARLSHARADPGAAQGLRRVGGGVQPRRGSGAATRCACRARWRARWRCRASPSAPSKRCARSSGSPATRYVSPFEFMTTAFRAGRSWQAGLSLAGQGVRRSLLRDAGA